MYTRGRGLPAADEAGMHSRMEEHPLIAIMQPYFLPYIGYFQLMNAVDEFVVYDNIEYTKKGWINRNRILVNGKDSYITLPLRKASDFLDIRDRYLSETWRSERVKLLNRIKASYRKAPHFDLVYPLIEECLHFTDNNLFAFLFNSLNLVREFIGVRSSLLVSSSIPVDHGLKSERKVIEICKARGAASYVNPIGGTGLYDRAEFRDEGICLYFLRTADIIYSQFENEFVPALSIIDVMMFNSREKIREYLTSSFELI